MSGVSSLERLLDGVRLLEMKIGQDNCRKPDKVIDI